MGRQGHARGEVKSSEPGSERLRFQVEKSFHFFLHNLPRLGNALDLSFLELENSLPEVTFWNTENIRLRLHRSRNASREKMSLSSSETDGSTRGPTECRSS